MLDKVSQALAKADHTEAQAKKRVKAKKPAETLDVAEARLLQLKLKDDERAIVTTVIDLLKNNMVKRMAATKLSKKEVFELWNQYQINERQRKRDHVLATKPDNFLIVTDYLTLDKLHRLLDNEPVVALDTETTGLDMYNDRIVGICGYYPNADLAFYVPFGHITAGDKEAFDVLSEQQGIDAAIDQYRLPNQLPKADVLALWLRLVTGRKTLWHNYKYDGHMTFNAGITPDAPWWDTQTAMRILNDQEPSYKLKLLHETYVAQKGEAITFEDLFPDFTIYDKPIDLAGIYAAGDAKKTYDLYVFQKPYMDKRDRLHVVWYEIEQKLLHIDLLTERVGFRIDKDYLLELEEEYTPKLEDAERDLLQSFGIDSAFLEKMSKKLGKEIDAFNVNSNDHLGYLIYDHIGADEKIGLRFKKGFRSTAADVVDALCENEPRLEPLLEYRTMAKLLGTYINKIPSAMEPATGRLHVAFKNGADEQGAKTGADTGRYSSSYYTSGKNSRTGEWTKGLNIQNIPSRNELGVKVRMAFIPDDGWLFVASDLSQIEPRVIAHILYDWFGDSSMRDLYLRGVDLYTTMAMQTFDLAEECCVDGAYDPTGSFKPRKLMKEGVLAYLYGQTPAAFARKMNVSLEVAERFFAGMIAAFPGLEPFRQRVLADLLTKGSVAFSETLYGRKRRYPNYRKDREELLALEAKCYQDGLDIYRKGGPKGRTAEEHDEIQQRIFRLETGELTEDDKEAILRIGLYWRNKPNKDRLWDLRKRVGGVERAAINMVVQGSAADVLKQIIIRLHTLCTVKDWKFMASIHDEVWTSIPADQVTPENVALVEECMTNTVNLTVPLKCDTVIQRRWMDENKVKNWDFEQGCPKAA